MSKAKRPQPTEVEQKIRPFQVKFGKRPGAPADADTPAEPQSPPAAAESVSLDVGSDAGTNTSDNGAASSVVAPSAQPVAAPVADAAAAPAPPKPKRRRGGAKKKSAQELKKDRDRHTKFIRVRVTEDEQLKWNQFAYDVTGRPQQLSSLLRSMLGILEWAQPEITERFKSRAGEIGPARQDNLSLALTEFEGTVAMFEAIQKAGVPRSEGRDDETVIDFGDDRREANRS